MSRENCPLLKMAVEGLYAMPGCEANGDDAMNCESTLAPINYHASFFTILAGSTAKSYITELRIIMISQM